MYGVRVILSAFLDGIFSLFLACISISPVAQVQACRHYLVRITFRGLGGICLELFGCRAHRRHK